jgi:hypothetical protein
MPADELDLIRTANRGVVTYEHGTFLIAHIEVDAMTAHRLRDLVFGGLLRLDCQLVEPTGDGLIAAGVPC